ncbi:KH domain-containing protein [bacterium]|nr:KH domain-containing protein [bacterium]
MLRDIVEFIVTQLVDDHAAVLVTEKREDKKIILSVNVSEQDFGKVIGKGGKTIRSIRSLISTLNQEPEISVFVDIAK